jgi:hypothetical protein
MALFGVRETALASAGAANAALSSFGPAVTRLLESCVVGSGSAEDPAILAAPTRVVRAIVSALCPSLASTMKRTLSLHLQLDLIGSGVFISPVLPGRAPENYMGVTMPHLQTILEWSRSICWCSVDKYIVGCGSAGRVGIGSCRWHASSRLPRSGALTGRRSGNPAAPFCYFYSMTTCRCRGRKPRPRQTCCS